MIATEKFVYIHMPKTGGTFVEKVLQKIHTMRGDTIRTKRIRDGQLLRQAVELLKPHNNFTFYRNSKRNGSGYTCHGMSRQIPFAHKNKTLLTTVRNPYDYYVSQYEFNRAWVNPTNRLKRWCKDEGISSKEIYDRYPQFPDISFEDWVEFSEFLFYQLIDTNLPRESWPGYQTRQFLWYFHKSDDVLRHINNDYVDSKQYRKDLRDDIHFIRTEELNSQLHDFLQSKDYADQEIEFIFSAEKVMPQGHGRSQEQSWEKYYTPELKQWVRNKERMLFELFPEFDV